MPGGVVSEPWALVALILLALFSYWHLRHAGLALLTVLAPLPGFCAAVFWLGDPQPLCYLAGFGAASFFAADIAARRAADDQSPIRAALQHCAPALIAALVLAAAAPFILTALSNEPALKMSVQRASQILAGGASDAILLTAGAVLLRYGETFVTNFNRAAERRMRWLAPLGASARPRWGWSISGIALVLSALGYFGLGGSAGAPVIALHIWLVVAAQAALVFAIAFLATRNFRRALAALLALVPVLLLAVWISHALRVAVVPLDLVLAMGVAAMPVLVIAARASGFDGQESAATANIRAWESCGPAIVFTVAAQAAALAAFERFAAVGLIEAMALLLAGLGALFLQPALSTMFYALFPKRVSLDAYRLR